MNNHRSKFTPIPAQITPKVKVIQRDFKSCSTSNIFLDSTITKPNVTNDKGCCHYSSVSAQ